MTKLKDRMLKDLFAILAELESGALDDNQRLKETQIVKLEMLYNYLGEDIPEEYWEKIETIIFE